MLKPVVLLDCDGILANFVGAALQTLFDVTGKRFESSIVTSWEVFDSIPEPYKASQKQVYDALKSHGGCASIPVYPEAVEGVRMLADLATIVVVTSPFKGSMTWMYERELWLTKHFGDNIKYVIHTAHKERIHGDVFIDDKAEHVNAWAKYWAHDDFGYPVLWETPRDKAEELHPSARRMSTWREVHAFVSELEKP